MTEDDLVPNYDRQVIDERNSSPRLFKLAAAQNSLTNLNTIPENSKADSGEEQEWVGSVILKGTGLI